MAIKTVLRNLLSHYGYMSVEMASALAAEENTAVADSIIAEGGETVIETTADAVSDAPDTPVEEQPVSDEEPYPFA